MRTIKGLLKLREHNPVKRREGAERTYKSERKGRKKKKKEKGSYCLENGKKHEAINGLK